MANGSWDAQLSSRKQFWIVAGLSLCFLLGITKLSTCLSQAPLDSTNGDVSQHAAELAALRHQHQNELGLLYKQSAAVGAAFAGTFRELILNAVYAPSAGLQDGDGWPAASPGQTKALSMAGRRRLDNMVAAISTIVSAGIPGDIIETGVWRGGISFMAAKTLEILSVPASKRKVYLCDSFSGIPNQTEYAQNRGHVTELVWPDTVANRLAVLNENSPEEVKRYVKPLMLDPEQLSFEVGYFQKTLPALVARVPDISFSVIRLDGDTYWSTYEALEVLYPRLSPGGYLIIDDFVDWSTCREAIDKFRTAFGIKEKIILVDHADGESYRGAYWRKSNPDEPDQDECVGAGALKGQLRSAGSINPSKLVAISQPGKPLSETFKRAKSLHAMLANQVRDGERLSIVYACSDDGSELVISVS